MWLPLKPVWITGRSAPGAFLNKVTFPALHYFVLFTACVTSHQTASEQTRAQIEFHSFHELSLNQNPAGVLKVKFWARLLISARQIPLYLFISPKYNWWTGVIGVRAGWRCSTTARGERCATTTGTWWTPTWCASSWTVAWLWRWAAALTSDKVPGSSFWTTSTAKETRPSSASATALAGTCTTATTMKMWGSPAKVMCFLSPSLQVINSN